MTQCWISDKACDYSGIQPDCGRRLTRSMENSLYISLHQGIWLRRVRSRLRPPPINQKAPARGLLVYPVSGGSMRALWVRQGTARPGRRTPAMLAPRRGELRSGESIPPSPPYSLVSTVRLSGVERIQQEFRTLRHISRRTYPPEPNCELGALEHYHSSCFRICSAWSIIQQIG